MFWIPEIEDDRVTFLQLATGFGHPMKRIDIRLFNQLLGALKSEKVARFALQIEVECEFGQGRQALRLAHRGMVQHGQRLAMASTTQIFALKCKDITHLEKMLTQLSTKACSLVSYKAQHQHGRQGANRVICKGFGPWGQATT